MVTPVTPENDVYTINLPSELAWIAQQVNKEGKTFAGKTVKLAKNIDLNNGAWIPVGQTGGGQFSGTFDGQNYTISAGRDAGQVAGAAKVANIIECSASQVTVTADGTSTGANIKNELIGRTL